MAEDHAPAGLLIAALAAAVLAISVFMPWYGVSITPSGAAAAKQQLATVAQEYGNTAFQTLVNERGPAYWNSLGGRQIAAVSAHQVMGRASTILLVLAGIALLASLLRLADMHGVLFATGSQIALMGGLAFAVVFYRVLVRPGAGVDFISVSPSWGIWVALLSAATITCGGLVAGSDRTRKHERSKVGPGAPTAQMPPRF
jgi:hypothetical protein